MNKHSHPLYRTWGNMKQRCTNPNRSDWKYYGGRGVRVCCKWSQFEGFLEDMGATYQAGLWLDRINSSGHYILSNCRWVTPRVQQQNRRVRASNPSGHKGVFRRTSGRFRCGIMIADQWTWLGTFETCKEAVAVRKAAEKRYYAFI